MRRRSRDVRVIAAEVEVEARGLVRRRTDPVSIAHHDVVTGAVYEHAESEVVAATLAELPRLANIPSREVEVRTDAARRGEPEPEAEAHAESCVLARHAVDTGSRPKRGEVIAAEIDERADPGRSAHADRHPLAVDAVGTAHVDDHRSAARGRAETPGAACVVVIAASIDDGAQAERRAAGEMPTLVAVVARVVVDDRDRAEAPCGTKFAPRVEVMA